MEKYQGEDISFRIKFQKGEDVNINSFNDLSEIILYIYTDGCTIAKFGYPSRSGYETLALTDNLTLTGVLSASKTKTMSPGVLRIEVMAKKGSDNMIEKKVAGIILVKDLIKSDI